MPTWEYLSYIDICIFVYSIVYIIFAIYALKYNILQKF